MERQHTTGAKGIERMLERNRAPSLQRALLQWKFLSWAIQHDGGLGLFRLLQRLMTCMRDSITSVVVSRPAVPETPFTPNGTT